MRINDLYAQVTANIIKDLEAGTAPWTKPWTLGNTGGILPVNGATGRHYSGINIPILWHAQIMRGFKSALWMTYKQAQERGAQVRKGEKATTVVFTKPLTVKDKETDEEKKIGMLKAYSVFNVAQIDGLTTPQPDHLRQPTSVIEDSVTAFIAATKADIRIGGDVASYTPKLDFICMPPEEAFKSREHFLAVTLHECCHWSGHETRLNRDLKPRFYFKAYAAEELIAELGAAFLCAHLGIKGELRHADYIASWIHLLQDDDRAVFTAASHASKAADYLRSFSEAVQEEET